jgi:hypothetical protein
MRTTQGNMLRSLTNVQTFLDEHEGRLAGVVTPGIRKQLDDVVVELSEHATDQLDHTIAAQQLTQRQRALRTILLQDHMGPIANIARVDLPQTPELAPLRLPNRVLSIERLAVAARAMGKAAQRHNDVLLATGLRADYLEQLEAATEAMVKSLNDRDASRGKVSGATTGLREKLSRSRRIVRAINSYVRKALRGDATLLRNWKSVKRVQIVPVQSVKAPSAPALSISTPENTILATEAPASTAVAAA